MDIAVNIRVERLGSTDWRVRHAAMDALSARGADVLDELLAGLRHPNWRVRAWCAELLDHVADENCVTPLLRLLGDPIARVRSAAVHALACQHCKPKPLHIDVAPLLIERALQDASIRVRRKAAHHLGLLAPDTRAVEALQRILATDSDCRLLFNAGWALQQHLSPPATSR